MVHGRGRSLPLRRVRVEGAPSTGDRGADWPWTMPAVAQLAAEGLELGAVTVLVGENGSGKSTLVEAIAMAYGMSGEGGSTGARHRTRPTESDLWKYLTLVREPGGARWGFFLRAETMHGFYSYLEDHVGQRPEPVFHEMSHGESFLAMLASERFRGPGLFLLDEPESALSFQGCLNLVAQLHELARGGGAQMIVATHSPLIAAVPGATVHELGPWGIRPSEWADLTLVQHWRSFLRDPQIFLRHLDD